MCSSIYCTTSTVYTYLNKLRSLTYFRALLSPVKNYDSIIYIHTQIAIEIASINVCSRLSQRAGGVELYATDQLSAADLINESVPRV